MKMKIDFFKAICNFKINNLNIPVFINSFWPGTHYNSINFIDPHGIFNHNGLWLSLFSGGFGTASPYYWNDHHPSYYQQS